jgi:hypothetical protein
MLIPLGILAAAGASGFVGAGYFLGGQDAVGRIGTVEKYAFPTDTRSAGVNLVTTTDTSAGFADALVAGYVAGGYDGGASPILRVEKRTFPAETTSTLGTGLSGSNGTRFAGFANSATAGYVMSRNFAVNKFAFPSDTRSTFTIALQNWTGKTGFANKGVAGYLGGGDPTRTNVEKVTFSTDTLSALATGLSVGVNRPGALADTAVAGYVAGGNSSGGNISTVNKFAFPSDTRSVLGTGLSYSAERLHGASNSGVAGYFGGGLPTTGAANKFDFPSDTRSVITSFATARYDHCSFANENI